VAPPYSFTENSFATTPLGNTVDIRLQRLVVRIRQRQIFFLTGAGLSAGLPTGLPTGPGVAAKLRDWADAEGLAGHLAALSDPSDLGEVAQALEDAVGQSAVLQEILRAVEWGTQPFNLGHLVLALLFAEEHMTESFTANWDPCVLKASQTIAGAALTCPCDLGGLSVARPPRFVHLHGRADTPASLVITNADLDRPQAMKWSQPQLAASTATADAAVVGFAAEPEYVLVTLRRMLHRTRRKPAAIISLDTEADFAARSADLATALGVGQPGSTYVQGGATDCLGEVARGVYAAGVRERLVEAERRAADLTNTHFALEPSAVAAVKELVLSQPLADFLESMWKAAQLADDNVALQPTLAKAGTNLEAVLASLMILASCSDVTRVSVQHGDVCFDTPTGAVDLWPVIPERAVSATTAVRKAVATGGRFTRPAAMARPLVLLCAGTDGVIPPGGHAALAHGLIPTGLAHTTRSPAASTTLDQIHGRICARGSIAGSPTFRELIPIP
jgi:hypothetical protein